MADSKRNIRTKNVPRVTEQIGSYNNPKQYYHMTPTWTFANVDLDMWAFSKEHIGEKIWTEIMPYLRAMETKTWAEILVQNKKQNHSLTPNQLNKIARKRLAEKYVEAESVISLRITGNHRIYGYMSGYSFAILWYDDDHGDNDTCVCRSKRKHT